MAARENKPRRTRGPSRSGPRPGQLTERDLEVLRKVYQYRYLSVSQTQALLFPSRQTALRRLKFLSENGYLRGFRVPGIVERIFGLGRTGAELVAEQLLVPASELGWNAKTKVPKDPWFMRHFLLVGWFRIGLTKELAKHDELELLGFIPEYVGETRDGGGVKKYLRDVVIDRQTPPRTKLTHTPDAVFALGRKSAASQDGGVQEAALFFLEVDRGTEVIANPDKGVLKTLRFYLALMSSDRHNRYAPDFGVKGFDEGFRVLFLTTSETRVGNIRTVGGRFLWHPEQAKRFIWLAPRIALDESRLFERSWQSLDPTDHHWYALR